MSPKETQVILGLLFTAYPKYYNNVVDNKDSIAQMVALWSEFFKDEEFKYTRIAVMKLIAISVFPPTIAEIRNVLAENKNGRILDDGEAWGEVISAIRNCGYMHEESALKSVSELTAKAIKCMGWLNLCTSEDQMADRAHFFRIYKSLSERARQENQVPLAIKQAIKLQLEQKETRSKECQEKQIIEFPQDTRHNIEFDEIGKITILDNNNKHDAGEMPSHVKDVLNRIRQKCEGENG